MPGSLRPARLDWSQDTPFSPDFGDVYFSTSGGAEESRHVFLENNDLPARFRESSDDSSFTIAETGFGTGLNWLTTSALWKDESRAGWLHYVSIEKHPLDREDLKKAHAFWPEFSELSVRLQQRYPEILPGHHRIVFPELRSTLTLVLGDITELSSSIDAQVDAWFLDGFAPDRNPDMWNANVYEAMARLSRPNATFATYTSAGHVRRGLQEAGFTTEKVTGFGRKREMLRGRLETSASTPTLTLPWLHRPKRPFANKAAIVIGAGIAGASTASRLAMRGWSITVIDEASTAAAGASGNPAAIMYPKLGPGDQVDNLFAQQAWLFAMAHLESEMMGDGVWQPCGVLQLLTAHQQRSLRASQDHPWIPALALPCSADAAGDIAGIRIEHDAIWFPRSGWLNARAYCQKLLGHPNIVLKTDRHASEIEETATGWIVRDDKHRIIAETPVVIAANGCGARKWDTTAFLPLKPVSGQISIVPASTASKNLKTVICHDGYISPALPDGTHCLGATFHPGEEELTESIGDHEANYLLQQQYLPELMASMKAISAWHGRVSTRCQSPDYLPIAGPVADINSFKQCYAGLSNGKVMDYPLLATRNGLYVNLAHGSRGFSQSLLCAEILAAEICNEPSPVPRHVLQALHPMRFAARDLKRNRK